MAVKNIIQNIRGSTNANDKYIGKPGEITIEYGQRVDKDKKTVSFGTIRVHDGNKQGGYKLALADEIPTRFTHLLNDADLLDSSGTINKALHADVAKYDEGGNIIHEVYARLDGATFNGILYAPNQKFNDDFSDNDSKVATTKWVDNAASVVHKTGNETIHGEKTFTEVIQGTALRANWADLAENYESDVEYPAGTLVCFGGDQEITIATQKVNGVVSEKPALLMNKECVKGLPVALAGRVNILVTGKVSKFDNIVLSSIAGVGIVDNQAAADKVIGKALQSKDTVEIGSVLCVTKFNLA